MDELDEFELESCRTHPLHNKIFIGLGTDWGKNVYTAHVESLFIISKPGFN